MSRVTVADFRSATVLDHALILTAGLGTRLRPLSLVRAKPAVPVAGEPVVRHIIRCLAASGVTNLVLNLHHLPQTVTAVVGDGSDLGAVARYSWEHPEILGSAGGPRRALPLIDAERFLVVNGDTLTDVEIGQLAAAHAHSNALITLALTKNRNPLKYGGVRLDHRERVTGFVPRGPEATDSYHFIGVQIAEARVFREAPDGPLASIGGLYDSLVRRHPGTVAGFVCDASFWDIGTVADYWRTSMTLGAAAQRLLPPAVRVHPTARVHRSILWDDIDIGADCTLRDCIVTDGVRLPAGACYRNVVLIQTNHGVSATPFEID